MTSVEEFNCILCKESFENKDELQVHFRKHGDPKFNESIKAKSRVQNVAPVANEKSDAAPEMVNCDVCDEVFPTISKAITHKHKLHPEHDAKYFCPWCGKLFTMKHLYNKHLQTNHDAVEGAVEKSDSHFHCDSCDVFFFIPAAMVYHNKFFHRQDTELPIIGHSKKQRLVNQDLLPLYYCSFCGEEYINKVNLHKHICDDHNDENQRPTDVLRCPLCEAIFYHLDAYELHLTFHTSEDLYSETNEMNETELSEFSLETVPPTMERIEDLNNLPDDETNTSAVGIESFLQMAMDEPHDDSQVSKKSKKHKKHKKSKKSAITLDEFLNMNQDVFGEDLDFQGVEEVPTKVIKRQLKPKKPQLQKAGVKFVSSAHLQKLEKQGIVVKMKPGHKPPSVQVKPIGQTVTVSPCVKNVTNQTTIKAISASNEVLSKLMNQSSNQLKIVKKPVQENVEITKKISDESELEDTTNNSGTDNDLINAQHMDNDCNINIEQNTMLATSKVLKDDLHNQDSNTLESNPEANQCINENSHATETQPKLNTDLKESDKDTNETNSLKKEVISVNHDVMNNTLRNISSQITIKPVNQSSKPSAQDKDDTSTSTMIDNNEDFKAHIDSDADSEQNDKTVGILGNINSEITIKSLKNRSVALDDIPTTDEKTEQDSKQIRTNISENMPVQTKASVEKSEELNVNECEDIKGKMISTSSHVLKNLSKNITIKSMSPSVKQLREDVTDTEQYYSKFGEDESKLTEKQILNRGVSTSPVVHKLVSPGQIVKPEASKSSINNTYTNMQTVKRADCDENIKTTNNQSSKDMLKHLKNITAKPVTATVNMNQQITARSSNLTTDIIKSNVKKTVQKNEVSQEIEIFNIDDSDSDGPIAEQPKFKQTTSIPKKLQPVNQVVKPVIQSNATLNAIKNISKNITVKPSSQGIATDNVKKEKLDFDLFSDEDEVHDGAANDSYDDEDIPLTELNKATSIQSVKHKSDVFKSVFKNLGKHITVKPRNVSQSPTLKSLDRGSQDYNENIASNDEESDAESCSGKVKITEVTEDNISDENDDYTYKNETKGAIVQSPEDSNSSNEHFSEEMAESDDNRNQTPGKVVNTPCPDLKSNNEFLKNISKNVTVKSLSERTEEKQGRINTPQLDRERILNQNSNKPFKQKLEIQNESVKRKTPNPGNSKQNTEPASSFRQSMNNKLVQPPGVVNVNKEVKVKTFQSETVIEEITTTVTKTIRRVNQVNQQVYNSSQTSAPRMIQQKSAPRMANCNQPQKNFQGITVRQPTPTMGSKIRQAVPSRPGIITTSVRPPNQLVPIRPHANHVRPTNNPRMPVRSMSNQPRPFGKPLKISPNAIKQTMKRPVTEDSSGPFSCFKKAKESLIPVNETALESGSDIHYASTSQTNKFCSTTKTVKDNTLVTNKQMKSEVMSQQLQMSKNSNSSGLKLTKAKQVSQVERTEMNTSKRITLEAIEKLQRQGLLVKKPRVEESEPTYSDAEDDGNDGFEEEG